MRPRQRTQGVGVQTSFSFFDKQVQTYFGVVVSTNFKRIFIYSHVYKVESLILLSYFSELGQIDFYLGYILLDRFFFFFGTELGPKGPRSFIPDGGYKSHGEPERKTKLQPHSCFFLQKQPQRKLGKSIGSSSTTAT
jgi:hypothetical protein